RTPFPSVLEESTSGTRQVVGDCVKFGLVGSCTVAVERDGKLFSSSICASRATGLSGPAPTAVGCGTGEPVGTAAGGGRGITRNGAKFMGVGLSRRVLNAKTASCVIPGCVVRNVIPAPRYHFRNRRRIGTDFPWQSSCGSNPPLSD